MKRPHTTTIVHRLLALVVLLAGLGTPSQAQGQAAETRLTMEVGQPCRLLWHGKPIAARRPISTSCARIPTS
jgi:hypothetical protein